MKVLTEISPKPMRIDVGIIRSQFAVSSLALLANTARLTRPQSVFDRANNSEELHNLLRADLEPAIRDYEKATGIATAAVKAPRDIVLFGFGRIGRLLARILIEKTGSGDKMLLRAIVVRKKPGNDLLKRASLLTTDSVHGQVCALNEVFQPVLSSLCACFAHQFAGVVTVDEKRNAIIANGNFIQVRHMCS